MDPSSPHLSPFQSIFAETVEEQGSSWWEAKLSLSRAQLIIKAAAGQSNFHARWYPSIVRRNTLNSQVRRKSIESPKSAAPVSRPALSSVKLEGTRSTFDRCRGKIGKTLSLAARFTPADGTRKCSEEATPETDWNFVESLWSIDPPDNKWS